MLGIQESIEIHCICIDNITGSFVEWTNINEVNIIMWKVYSAFTLETVSISFKALHMTKIY